MKYRSLLAWPLLCLALHGCDFGKPIEGGGTGGDGLALSGRVVDAQGSPVAGAKVRAYPLNTSLAKRAKDLKVFQARLESTSTDSTGTYRFHGIPAGQYNVHASMMRNDSVWSLLHRNVDLAVSFYLGTDTLRLSGSLRITVRDTLLYPLGGVQCAIPGSPWKAISDAKGNCLLTGLAPGVYRITFTYSGLPTGEMEDVVVASGVVADGGFYTFSAPTSGFSNGLWLIRYDAANDRPIALTTSGSLLVGVGDWTDTLPTTYRGLILTSTDGVTWTKRSAGTTAKLTAVTWSGDKFVAVGDHGAIMTSMDGADWIQQNLTGSEADTTLQTVEWAGNRFVAGSAFFSAVSADGLTWTRSSPLPFAIRKIFWTGSACIALTDSLIQVSVDGLNWKPAIVPTPKVIEDLAFMNGIAVAVGRDGSILTSTDGFEWQLRQPNLGAAPNKVIWLKRWRINFGLYVSDNGIDWRLGTSEGDLIATFVSVTSTGGRWVAIVNGGYNVIPSADGQRDSSIKSVSPYAIWSP